MGCPDTVQRDTAALSKREYVIFIFQKYHACRGSLPGHRASDALLCGLFGFACPGKSALYHFSLHFDVLLFLYHSMNHSVTIDAVYLLFGRKKCADKILHQQLLTINTP